MKFLNKQHAMDYLRAQPHLVELVNGSFIYPRSQPLPENQVKSPHFVPVRYKDGWYVKVIHFYKNGRNIVRLKDGKCQFVGQDYLVNEAA